MTLYNKQCFILTTHSYVVLFLAHRDTALSAVPSVL